MLFESVTFIGIDPTAGQKPFTYAALDNDLRIIALGEGRMEDILAFTAGQRRAWVAVCAPQQPNQGFMMRQEIRQNLSPIPQAGRWLDFRLAEYLIRQRNIIIPQTPAMIENCPNWMKMGFMLFSQLQKLGYLMYPDRDGDLVCLEIYPHASYAVLLETLPFQKYTLEGRLQRQLVLYDRKIKLPDPMAFFEEITRFKILKGKLPLDQLYQPGELDALVGAYTAWLAANEPGQVSALGDPGEGQIVLPTSKLKPRYTS